MKKFLQLAAKLQQPIIDVFLQKKEIANIGDIGGSKVSISPNAINFSVLSKMVKNVDNFIKERRQFKEDSGKVVLEKNFLHNYIKATGASFFVFRPTIYDNEMLLETPENFSEVWSETLFSKNTWHILTFFLVIMSFALMSKSMPVGLLTLLLPLVLFFIIRHVFNKIEKTRQTARELYINSPSMILSCSPCSFSKGGKQRFVLEIDNYYSNTWVKFYDRTLSAMAITAARMGEKISWLYYYGGDVEISHWDLKFNRRQGDLDLNKTTIILNPQKDAQLTLIPIIETQNSYIFFVDQITEKMDISDKIKIRYLSNHEQDEQFLVPIED